MSGCWVRVYLMWSLLDFWFVRQEGVFERFDRCLGLLNKRGPEICQMCGFTQREGVWSLLDVWVCSTRTAAVCWIFGFAHREGIWSLLDADTCSMRECWGLLDFWTCSLRGYLEFTGCPHKPLCERVSEVCWTSGFAQSQSIWNLLDVHICSVREHLMFAGCPHLLSEKASEVCWSSGFAGCPHLLSEGACEVCWMPTFAQRAGVWGLLGVCGLLPPVTEPLRGLPGAGKETRTRA